MLPDALHVGVEQYYLYGDAAYMVRPWLRAAFSSLMTLEQEDCNGTMKVPRAAVEWGFKDVKQVCSTLDFPLKMRIRESPVDLLYQAGVFMWNMPCFAYGGATSTYSKCPPPTWREYLGLDPHANPDDDEDAFDDRPGGANDADGGGRGAGRIGGGGSMGDEKWYGCEGGGWNAGGEEDADGDGGYPGGRGALGRV